MSDTKVIDTKISFTWLVVTTFMVLGSLSSLIWFAATQNGKLERILDQQAEAKQQQAESKLQQQARDVRDETYRTTQSTAIAEIRLNDSRQDLRIENLEKAVRMPQPLGRWTK